MKVPPPVAFAATTLIWGTTWLAIKIGYEGLDPLWGAALRFLAAGSILIVLALSLRLAPPKSARHWLVIASVGLCTFTIDYGLIYLGEQHLASGLTAVILGSMPLFSALVSLPLAGGDRLGPIQWTGLLIGLGGLVLLFYDDVARGADLAPTLAIVLASFAAAVGNLIVRTWGHDLPSTVLNAGSMFLGGLILFVGSIALGERIGLPSSGSAWAALAYLVLFGSITAFFLFYGLLRKWGAPKAGLVTILAPLVALFVGTLYGETLTPPQWIGSAIVVLGVAFALRPRLGRIAAPAATAPAGPERS